MPTAMHVYMLIAHCKNRLIVVTHLGLPQLQLSGLCYRGKRASLPCMCKQSLCCQLAQMIVSVFLMFLPQALNTSLNPEVACMVSYKRINSVCNPSYVNSYPYEPELRLL